MIHKPDCLSKEIICICSLCTRRKERSCDCGVGQREVNEAEEKRYGDPSKSFPRNHNWSCPHIHHIDLPCTCGAEVSTNYTPLDTEVPQEKKYPIKIIPEEEFEYSKESINFDKKKIAPQEKKCKCDCHDPQTKIGSELTRVFTHCEECSPDSYAALEKEFDKLKKYSEYSTGNGTWHISAKRVKSFLREKTIPREWATEEIEKILIDEIALAHTTQSGKTSRLTSAYNRIHAFLHPNKESPNEK